MAYKTKIDIDKALAIHNRKDPDNKMTRKDLLAKMANPITRMTLHNWKNGNFTKGFQDLIEIAELCKCDIKDFATKTEL